MTRYRLTLVALPGVVPPLYRLKAVLKALLRRHRLRVERLEELASVTPSRREPS